AATNNLTHDNLIHLITRLTPYPLPLPLHVSNLQTLMPRFHFYFIPTLMNTNHTTYHDPILLQPLKQFRHVINFHEVIFQGYLILNSDSKLP
ncbi:geranylgeranylglyceryl/heptaprenylglyceryl phosphate synthase, partial [Staphylococcus capitis]|uniref:geranylgeranylglyceryl/heptaprenylglyceryl phosphate synthase n=1 Tax=Staphylococcus capitis TaxID=29388 RepID=UPI0028CB2D54